MGIELMRNQNRNYACIRLEEGQVHTHERSMLIYNRVPHLLPVNVRYVDEMLYAEYDVSGMQPLSGHFMHHRLTKEQIAWLIRSLYETQEVLLEYMLSPDGLILEPDYVFVDASDMSVRFCYQPGMRARIEENIQPLLQYMLDHVDYNDQEAVTLAYALYHLEDETGNIISTLEGYVEKTIHHAQMPSAADTGPEEESVLKGICPDMQKTQQGFFYRLLHRKSKRTVLLEHAASLEDHEEPFFPVQSLTEKPVGKAL